MLRPWIQTLSSPFATRSTCFLPSLCQPRITPPWPLRMLNSYSERFTIARPNPMAQSSGCCVHTPSGTKDVSTPSSSERNSCWLTISSSSIAEAFGLERGTLPSEGADGTAQSGLSLRVFNDAPEHREQSVTALFDSLTLRPPMVKCNWEKMPAQRWHKAMRGSYNDSWRVAIWAQYGVLPAPTSCYQVGEPAFFIASLR